MSFQKTAQFLPKWTSETFFPEDVVFFITVFFFFFLWIYYEKSQLSKYDLPHFQELINELLRLEEYQEILSLLTRHWGKLVQIHEARFPLPTLKKKIRKYLIDTSIATGEDRFSVEFEDFSWGELILNDTDTEIRKARKPIKLLFHKILFYPLNGLRKLLPDFAVYSETVKHIFQSVLSHEKFVNTLAKLQPYFVFQIFSLNKRHREKFLHLFFRSLLRDQYSVLYLEIRNNQDRKKIREFVIERRNKRLCK